VKTDTRGTQVGNSSHQFIASQRAYMHYVGGVKCESINQNKMYFKGTENCKREIQRSVFVISMRDLTGTVIQGCQSNLSVTLFNSDLLKTLTKIWESITAIEPTPYYLCYSLIRDLLHSPFCCANYSITTHQQREHESTG